MSLLKWAIFGLLMLPFVEIAIFIAVALKLGILTALALTILTSFAGMAVIRNAGARDVQSVRTAFGERTINRVELDGHGFLTVLGGFLLSFRGFSPTLWARCCCCRRPRRQSARHCAALWAARSARAAGLTLSISRRESGSTFRMSASSISHHPAKTEESTVLVAP